MRDVRSKFYQYKYAEVCVDDRYLSSFADSNELSESDKQKLEDLKKELFNRVMELMEKHLSIRQIEILKMYFLEEMTQKEIAKEFGILQASVCNSMEVRSAHLKSDKTRNRVGSLYKIKKIAMKDEQVKNILKQIEELS